MTRHTPGPWKVVQGKRGTLGQFDSDKMKPFTFVQTDFHASGKIKNGPEAAICEMRTGERAIGVGNGSFHHHITDEEVQSNAWLIAAAPELFVACSSFLAAWDSNAYNAEEFRVALLELGIVGDIREAVSKAVQS